jgi:hypothetical protein
LRASKPKNKISHDRRSVRVAAAKKEFVRAHIAAPAMFSCADPSKSPRHPFPPAALWYASRSIRISSAFNTLPTLAVTTGVTPSVASVLLTLCLLCCAFSRFCHSCVFNNLQPLSSQITAAVLYFQQLAASFANIPGVGTPQISILWNQRHTDSFLQADPSETNPDRAASEKS